MITTPVMPALLPHPACRKLAPTPRSGLCLRPEMCLLVYEIETRPVLPVVRVFTRVVRIGGACPPAATATYG
jgi:hypothetical protein